MLREPEKEEIENIKRKYLDMINKKLGNDDSGSSLNEINKYPERNKETIESKEYKQFKEDLQGAHITYYENACNICEKYFKIAPDQKKAKELQEGINASHLQITPTGAVSFSFLAPVLFVFIVCVLSSIPFIISTIAKLIDNKSTLFANAQPEYYFMILALLIAVSLMVPLQNVPVFLGKQHKLKASGEMILGVFYLVTYMRHTPNMELAVQFASQHLTGPLALDFKKVVWDIETEKFSNIKESMDYYLETWRDTNLEFVEAVHLIESSLYESDSARRDQLLDKSLDVILEESFEKMLHYAQDLKPQMTSLHMLGIILPILGLVILPLAVNFMDGIEWYHIAPFYNIIIPGAVFLMGSYMLAKRPGGYSSSDILEVMPELKKYRYMEIDWMGKKKTIDPKVIGLTIMFIFLFLGFLPLMLKAVGIPGVTYNVGFGEEDGDKPCGHNYCFNHYVSSEDKKTSTTKLVGPFDIYSAILSMGIPLGLGLGLGFYYKKRSEQLMKIREEAEKLEQEFSSALFQLGNRLGDNIPAEIAFGKVADIMHDTPSGNFFNEVSNNITSQGMSVESAIFNKKSGAINKFPSTLIKSSMEVFVQSIVKSPKIASQAVISISRYIKEMHRVDERLKDLLSDVISSLKSQVSYLTAVISGIVVGLTSMITNILGAIAPVLAGQANGGEGGVAINVDFFGTGLPTYYFQLFVGLFVIQIVYIMTILSNGIENGSDPLKEEYELGQNLQRSAILYVFIATAVMIVFNFIASQVLVGLVPAK